MLLKTLGLIDRLQIPVILLAETDATTHPCLPLVSVERHLVEASSAAVIVALVPVAALVPVEAFVVASVVASAD